MKTNESSGEIVLCLSAVATGQRFLTELVHLDCRVVLLTLHDLRDADWPREFLAELHTMPGGMTLQQIIHTVAYLARSHAFTRIFALDPSLTEAAATLREHLQIPGMGITTTRYFRDRLAMRRKAAHLGVRVPAFTSVVNYDDLRAYMENVPAPWLLQPRCGPSDPSIPVLHNSEQVWRTLDALGDRQSYYFLEQIVSGDPLHVDAIAANGRVAFAAVHFPVKPSVQQENPLDGETAPVSLNSAQARELKRTHASLLRGFGLVRGAAESEFLRSHATGELYFLETSAAFADQSAIAAIERARGLNLWEEWARLEIAALRGQPYALPRRNAVAEAHVPEPQSAGPA